MNYVEIVNLVFTILFDVYMVMMIPFAIFFVIGIFKAKKYPHTDVKNSYAIVIAARNEEHVVGNLIDSIKKSDYPLDKLHIFVMAHNCTDKTAEVCRQMEGVTVFEYSNPNECTKGYGLNYAFRQIEELYGIHAFDGYYIMDSDNIVAEDFFTKMNDAFEYYHHENIITSFRNSKNFGYNTMSGLYGIYFALGCIYEQRGRTVTGCSTRVSGTGYVVPAAAMEKGWNYLTLTEDWEFTDDQILYGNKIEYCDEAVFYDEQPTTFKIMWRQRVRWSKGHLLVCYGRIKELFCAIFKKSTKHRVSTYDIFTNTLPFCLILTMLSVLQYTLLLFSPLFGVSLWDAFIAWDYNQPWWYNLFLGSGALVSLGKTTLMGYLGMMLMAVGVFVLVRKRMFHLGVWRKIWLCIVWPAFVLIQFPIDVAGLFARNLGWKVIPHQDKTTIHSLNEKKKK